MSERRLITCDNCEETLELSDWQDDDESADLIADQGWHVLVPPLTDDEETTQGDLHFCSVRCLAVWATATAITNEQLTVRLPRDAQPEG